MLLRWTSSINCPPRDSFFGGRTNAIKLYHEVKEPEETIEYFDLTRCTHKKIDNNNSELIKFHLYMTS